MAVLAGPTHTLSITHDHHSTSLSPVSDPFWHTPPQRTAAPELASLMVAIQRVLQPPSSVTATPTYNPSKIAPATTLRRPQCTHMSVTRRYSNAACGICGRVPSLGWLYVCQQDGISTQLEQIPPEYDTPPLVPGHGDDREIKARIAESLSMRPDVVRGIRDMHYTHEQVDKLICQRNRVLDIIRTTQSSVLQNTSTPQDESTRADSVISSVGAKAAPLVHAASNINLLMTPAGTPTNTPLESTTNTPIKKTAKSGSQPCTFQVCHSCRPFFQDRLYMSFEAALSGRMPAVTEEDIELLPLLNPFLVRNLGLRERRLPPLPTQQSRESMDVTSQQGDGYEDDLSTDWTPTSATISESDSEHLDPSEQYPCPGAGICPLWSPHLGCAYDRGFDDSLRRLNHGFGPEPNISLRMTPNNSYSRLRHMRSTLPPETPGRASSTASSISLPTPDTVPLTPLQPADEPFNEAFNRVFGSARKAASVCPILTDHGIDRKGKGKYGLGISRSDSTSSSLGSEVEVEGGVALTEEAVGMGRPDIVTDEE